MLATLAVIIFLAFTVQMVAGFGAVLIALTLGSMVLPIRTLLPIVVPFSIALSLTVAVRDRAAIPWRMVMREIAPFMAVGFAGGVLLFRVLDPDALRTALGVAVVGLSLRELYALRANAPARADVPLAGRRAAYGVSGVLQGFAAIGGPVLVYALGRLELPKRAFRGINAAVFTLFNLVLIVSYAADGAYTLENLTRIASIAPAIVAAFVVGEFGHDRLPQRHFSVTVFGLLLVAGLALVLR